MLTALFLDEFLPCSTNPTAQRQPFLFINGRLTEITPEMAEEHRCFRGPGIYYDPDAVPVPIPPKNPPKYFRPRSDPSILPPQSSSSAMSESSTLLSAPAGNGISYWSERRSAGDTSSARSEEKIPDGRDSERSAEEATVTIVVDFCCKEDGETSTKIYAVYMIINCIKKVLSYTSSFLQLQATKAPSSRRKKLQATKAPTNWREASQAIQDLTGPMRNWRYITWKI